MSEKSDGRQSGSFERDERGRGFVARGAARASLLIGPITVITESFGAGYEGARRRDRAVIRHHDEHTIATAAVAAAVAIAVAIADADALAFSHFPLLTPYTDTTHRHILDAHRPRHDTEPGISDDAYWRVLAAGYACFRI